MLVDKFSSKPTPKESWKNPCHVGESLHDGHLGGTAVGGDPDSWFPELWDSLRLTFNAETMLDVGCGCGYAQKYFQDNGLDTFGIDGSAKVLAHHVLDKSKYALHDLTVSGVWIGQESYDIVWCCEVAEHIYETCVHDLVETLVQNTKKVLALCAAPPDCGGYHHVNCKPAVYWIDLLSQAGMNYEPELTEQARDLCLPSECGRVTMMETYFQRGGLIFTAQPRGCAIFEDK